MKTIYKGSVVIENATAKGWEKKLRKIKKITGYLYIEHDAKLDALQSVGGDLYIRVKINSELEKHLWKICSRKKWYLTEHASEWLLKQKGNFIYRIEDIEFDKELFDAIRKDELSAAEVFSIESMEQRRVAYSRMDKSKMEELGGFRILNETTDNYGNRMAIVSFNLDGFDKPFKYLDCICPSTQRRYFLETQKDTCQAAKMASFDLSEVHQFDKEY